MREIFIVAMLLMLPNMMFSQVGFTASVVNGCGPLYVEFQYQGQAGTDFLWDFGVPTSLDSNNSSLQSPTHTFNISGQFTVTLTVTLMSGQDTTVTKTI